MNRIKSLKGVAVCAVLAAGIGAYASIPVKESSVVSMTPSLATKSAVKAFAPAEGAHVTFFEGFEENPGDYGISGAEWLPKGWKDVSKAGNTVPGSSEPRYNLTWQVLTNENKSAVGPVIDCSAYEGESFAYIFPDMAYGDHTDLANQDEWLITPSITPQGDDWLYFRLFYYPAWVVYNRATNGFDGRNNQLEVLASTDGGKTWQTIWNVVDDVILKNYTEAELRKNLTDISNLMYEPVFVSIKDYIGQPTRFAFRYFGSLGQAMALDNITVGVPVPRANYTLPLGFFRQGISPKVEYPVNPKLLAPPAVEARWVNRSEDAMTYEWSYSDADGKTVSSDVRHLITPAYPFGTNAITPVLKAMFEKAVSEPYSVGYSSMQVGGQLKGTDTGGYEGEFGVGYYDITEPGHSVKYSSEYVSLNPNIDLAWEKILGQVDGSVDVLGFCTYFEAAPVAYGFDYVDVTALVQEDVPDDEYMLMTAFSLDSDGYVEGMIGQAILEGKDIPKAKREYVNLRFNFPVPVYADRSVLLMVSGLRTGGNVVFPNIVANGDNYGNNLILLSAYDPYTGEYEAFQNLSYLNYSAGHFAGLIVTMGASYSWMDRLDDNVIDVPYTGGTAKFSVRAYHAPERWKLTANGITEAEFAGFSAVYNQVTDSYDVTVTVEPNHEYAARPEALYLVSPGSLVEIALKQPGDPNAGLTELTGGENGVSVLLNGNILTVKGGNRTALVSNVAGQTVASVALDGTTASADLGALAPGVYLVTVDGASTFKILKK